MRFRVIAMLVGLAGVAAACGSDDPSVSGSASGGGRGGCRVAGRGPRVDDRFHVDHDRRLPRRVDRHDGPAARDHRRAGPPVR